MKYLFYNGNIVTLEASESKQAMLVEDGIITKIGDNRVLIAQANNVETVDLNGKTVLPGFIDTHSHLSSYANSLLQARLETTTSFTDLIAKLKEFEKENNLQSGQWLIASGYDHNKLKEKVHPTKRLLDEAFPNLNVVLQHQSGHFGVFNSAALSSVGLADIDKDGYIEENAFVDAIKKLPLPAPEQLLDAYNKAFARYASYGITTIQEGMMVKQMLPIYQMLLGSKTLTLDVVGYPQISDATLFYETFKDYKSNYYKGFRLGGYKIILDGSPQGKTAWMKTPYAGTSDNFGVSTMDDKAVLAALEKAVSDKRQLLAHCNGDAAAQQLLSCAKQITDKNTLASIRPVIIHAQLLQTTQLPLVKALGFIPSFFVAHCYYWGDVHIENFGMARAQTISPVKSAINEGICFTFHQDTPVIEPDMLQTIWCAVNRKTKKGIVLGKEERIPVLDALKAVTINAAYQYGEENEKGTLTVGKKADFVVLDQNPLTVSSDEIRDITVEKTYKSGECVYYR